MKSTPSKSLIILTICLAMLGVVLFFVYDIYIKNFVRTTDAYVTGNKINLQSQINGYVKTIYVDETQSVKQGDLLIELDSSDSLLAVEKASSDLAQEVRNINSLIGEISKTKADIEAKKAVLQRAAYDYDNRLNVVDTGSIAKEDFEHAQTSLMYARADLLSKEFELTVLKAKLLNSTPYNHPKVEFAKAALKTALLALRRCRIYAPSDGIVTQRAVQIGQSITKEETLLSIVPLNQIWIDANFKETQLKGVKVGQRVEYKVDMWGHDVIFYGTVVGQNPGTGAVFSPIPPQNATGNWIKIVQRIPVRISIDQRQLDAYPLWLGLSCEVKIDLRQQNLPIINTTSRLDRPYSTEIYDFELKGWDDTIQSIIEANMIYEASY